MIQLKKEKNHKILQHFVNNKDKNDCFAKPAEPYNGIKLRENEMLRNDLTDQTVARTISPGESLT